MPTKVHRAKATVFPVVMYGCELHHKEGWALKNWCFQTVVLQKALESPDYKEVKPVNPKGNQPWIFIRRADVKAEALILWPADAKSRLTEKDPDARKDWRQEKGTTEDEMVGWHRGLHGHESEQTPGDTEAQGSLACRVHGVTKSETQVSDWTTITGAAMDIRWRRWFLPSRFTVQGRRQRFTQNLQHCEKVGGHSWQSNSRSKGNRGF